MSHPNRRLLASLLALSLAVLFLPPGPAAADHGGSHAAGEWLIYKRFVGKPLCNSGGLLTGPGYFDRSDCGFGYAFVANTISTSSVKVQFLDRSGAVLETQTATFSEQRGSDAEWRFNINPQPAWPAGEITIRIAEVNGEAGNFGERIIYLNYLAARVNVPASVYRAGEDIPVSGSIFQVDEVSGVAPPSERGVPATYKLRVVDPGGTQLDLLGPFTAAADGTFSQTVPGSTTLVLDADAENDYKTTISVEVVDARYTDSSTGEWAANRAGAGGATIFVPPSTLIVENSFISSVGWVKPGAAYTFRVFVKNYTASAFGASENPVVTIPVPDGATYTEAIPTTPDSGTATIAGGTLTWHTGPIPAAAADGTPAVKTLVVLAEAETTTEDPEIVWKNLSSTATLTHLTGPSGLTSTSLGPKVIPPSGGFETARYGYRPFPVVPVDYLDRKHRLAHTGQALANKINAPDVPGSTYNLWQEMSYEQLSPHGTVPSASISSRGWDYAPGFDFSDPRPGGACNGVTIGDVPGAKGSPPLPERITNGWYQLPGDTQYYGGDQASFGTIAPAFAGAGVVGERDSACGPRAKAVYDAAQIADPEIDYSDYDTDKDGLVDFFMMVFVGCGGNGPSQLGALSCPDAAPYDNIWPHSWTLEATYIEEGTGLRGYISDDQLKDDQGRPMFYTDDTRTQMTTTQTTFPVYVRVGPYNVNPETAIDKASVISHEYGHSLGLPDFYSGGSRGTYGTWNLMATDHSQHMDIFGRQEMGWVVPRVLEANQTVSATEWEDGKKDIHSISWQRPDGTPYTLTGPDVHNGMAYVAKLPGRQILDPAKFDSGGSPSHVWWSQAGNDFGCPPTGGHNLDVALPELQDLPAGTEVTATLSSLWDIEWDYDFGFVMVTTDGGQTYRSLPSENGYTSDASHNRGNSCQTQYSNGITGSSGSYEAGTQELDRLQDTYPESVFLEDEYDLSGFVGENTVLRFSYSTDGGLARPGWFIDDVKITAGENVLYESDFEGSAHDPRLFPGGCRGEERTAGQCTAGWQPVDAATASTADHAYYLEMRDRSGFDRSGRGEDDRGDGPTFAPGLSLAYTDEAHGYGNVGADDPPPQTVLDSQPQPGNRAPALDDAAWTASDGDDTFSDSGEGHTDNYTDPANTEVDPRYASVPNPWRFRYNCLSFTVDSMGGHTVGPDPVPPYDLTGDVTLTTGAGCAPFDYGHADPDADPDEPQAANAGPRAVPQAKPTNAKVGETVTFDGSASFDDRQAPNQLRYEWDFDGDGTFDATGQVQRHAYSNPGTYRARLRVTDLGGLTDVGSIGIVVTGCGGAQPGLNQISGTAGGETLVGTSGNDVICALGGNDVVRGLGGNDIVLGGDGRDLVRGGTGNDSLRGEKGADRLLGQKGKDRLVGGPGKDRLAGGPGRDRLSGGKAVDRVHGGPGPDRCATRGDRTRSCRSGRRR